MKWAIFISVLLLVSGSPFETRRAIVDYVNSQPVSWTAGVDPRFENMAWDAYKHTYGADIQGTTAKTAEALASGQVKMAPKISPEAAKNLPDSFDSAQNWPQCSKVIGDIRDQSNCGCCWAFAAASAASDRACIATNGSISVPFSAQDVCFNAKSNGCDGADVYTPWAYIQMTGVVSGNQYLKDIAKVPSDPFDGEGFCSSFSLQHCHHHGPVGGDPYPAEGTAGCPKVASSPSGPNACDETSKIKDFKSDKYAFNGTVFVFPSDEASIRQAIMTSGPVEATYVVYEDFEAYTGGVYSHVTGRSLGGHAVRIVGWGKDNGVDYWKVANTWNPYWGESGYFRIKRGTNECYIESSVYASDDQASWGKKYMQP